MAIDGAPLPVPAWMVNASRLRETLDGIRDGLRHSATPPWAPPVGYDRHRIAESLGVVAGAAASLDRNAMAARVSARTSHTSRTDTQRFLGLLQDLETAWRKRIGRFLGPDKAALVRQLLDHSAPDFLDILRKADDENSHSDVLRWMLDPSCAPTIAPAALSGLVTRFAERADWEASVHASLASRDISVRREFVIGRASADGHERDRVDVVIWGRDFVIAIEAKMWSLEHGEQTEVYWRWMEGLPYRRGGLFLSPTGHAPACTSFVPISFLELLSCLLEGPSKQPLSSTEESVLAGYVKTLAARVIRPELRRHNLEAINGKPE